jgi:hypothetical protein
MTDQELAQHLANAHATLITMGQDRWVLVARRARELLLPREAEAVLKVAVKIEEVPYYGLPKEFYEAVRAYREKLKPKPRWAPDHYGFIHGPDDIHLAVQNRPGEEPADAARRVARLLNDWLVPEPGKTDAS